MATGNALSLLEHSTNLIDVDINHKPTTTPKLIGYDFLLRFRLIQINHIHISPGIKTANFKVYLDDASDRRTISANIYE